MKTMNALIISVAFVFLSGCITTQQKDEAFLAIEQTNAALREIADQLEDVKDSEDESAAKVADLAGKIADVAGDVEEVVKDVVQPIVDATTPEETAQAVGSGMQTVAPMLPPGWSEIVAILGGVIAGAAGESKRRKSKEDSFKAGMKVATGEPTKE